MDERASRQIPAAEPMPPSRPAMAPASASDDPSAAAFLSADVPQPAASQPATPQRHYVHHSYIWLGTLRSAGIIIVALGVSLFSSLVGMLFEGSDEVDGFTMAIVGLGAAAVILIIVALCLGYQWWSFRHLWYELGDEEFSLYSGIFNKKRVHVPYQRVQSVDQRASLLQRLFGVCTIAVDTAGGAAHTAVTVPYLLKDQAERLRMELYLRKRRILGLDRDGLQTPKPDSSSVPAPMNAAQVGSASASADRGPRDAVSQKSGNVLDAGAEVWDDLRGVFAGDEVYMGISSYEYGLTNKELLFTGLSNNTGFVLAVIGLLATVFQIAGDVMKTVGGETQTIAGTAISMGSNLFGGSLLILGIVFGIAAVLVLWAISVVGTCVQFGGFEARRRGSRIEVEHGLLQHRIRGVDVDRVQSVVVKQSVVRRLMGYCELSLGKIDAVDGSQNDRNQGIAQQGLVIHPFVKLDRVPEILSGIIPEFADAPIGQISVAPVALRRAVIRRAILQGVGFWLAVVVILLQIAVNALWDPVGSAEQTALAYLNAAACAAYVVCAVVFVLEIVGAVLWARGSGFAYNRSFMQVTNGGMAREIVGFPRRKLQFGYTKTNPFQRRAHTATIAVRTAAGTGGTTVRLIDVCEDDAQAWLEWVRPRSNALS